MGGRVAAIVVLGCMAAVDAASAQLICPPGTTIQPSNSPFSAYRCAPGGAAPKTEVVSSLPVKSSLTPPKREERPIQRAVYEGNAPQQRPSERATERRGESGPAACAGFNARVSALHHSFADRYGDRARERDHSAERLESAVARQEELSRDLTRQAGRTRDLTLRRHFRLQSQELRDDTEAKRRELAALRSANSEESARWKSEYQGSMRALLSERPKNCEVTLAQ